MNPLRATLLFFALSVGLSCRPGTPHSVTLTWQTPKASEGASIVGYNIYRWTSNDSRSVKIAGRISGPPYEDHQVVSGQTYFYAVTAVDQSGRESRLSENTQAKVP